MAEWLGTRGHEVRILTSRANRSAAGREKGVYRSLWPQAHDYHYRPLDFFLHHRRREKANLEALSDLLEDYSPDLVVVWSMWNLTTLLPELLEKRIPDRVVYYLASYWPTDLDLHLQYWQSPARRRWRELLKKLLRGVALGQLRADGYPPQLRFERSICVSHFVRERLISSGVLQETAQVIYLCVPPESCVQVRSRKGPDRRLRLLSVGRLVRDKGTHLALEALARLDEEQRSRVLLTIAGGGHPDYEEELQSIVTREGLEEIVEFAGQVTSARIAQLLGSSDVLLFTSVWAEPFARTVLEAMGAGVLVIGSEVGGQPEILRDGENALTFECGNVDQLARSISRVISNRELVHQLGRAGQETVTSRFTQDITGSSLEGYLDRVLDGVGGSLP